MTEFEILNFNLLNTTGACKALADICFENDVLVKGIKLMNGNRGLFVVMPNIKRGDEYYPICLITNKRLKQAVKEALIRRYKESENGKAE